MYPHRTRARQATRELYELVFPRWKRKRPNRQAEIHSLLDELVQLGDPFPFPCLVSCMLASENSETQQAARAAIIGLVSSFTPSSLIHVNTWTSWPYHRGETGHWYEITPADIPDLAGPPTQAGHIQFLGLLSFYHDGYVRQAAVRQLALLSDGSEIPFLLVRLNDWVEPVANDARAAIDERMTDACLPHFVRALPLVLHLLTFRRSDHREVVQSILDRLLTPKHGEILLHVLSSSDRKTCRHIVRYGLEQSGEHQSRIIETCLGFTDPAVRMLCCHHLTSAYAGDRLAEVLEHLTTDPFMPLRRAALRQTVELFPARREETWHGALMDASRSIRELARFSLAPLSDADFAEIYRHRILENPNLLPQLEGLAETGDSSDVPFFRQLLQHHLPSRRAAAVRGLGRVAGKSAIPDLLPALQDDSPCVLRALRRVLEPYWHDVPIETIVQTAIRANSRAAGRNAIDILADMGKWRSTSWLLAVARDAEPEIAQHAGYRITEWLTPPKCNKVWTAPTAEERQKIAEALQQSKGHVSSETLDVIEASLAQLG